MPQYKQPLSLVQLTLKSLEDFVLLLGYQLMSIACKPPSEEQWTSIKCFLQPGLPLSIANRLTEHLLGVLTVIAQEAGNVMYCYHLDELDREVCMNIVRELIEAVINPGMLELVIPDCPGFMCETICTHLNKLTSLKTLKLQAVSSYVRKNSVRNLVEMGIGFMKNLRVFRYEKNCTDRIIEVLSENCSYLEELDVMFSKHVTVESLNSISKLQNLKSLNVWGTFINRKTCAEILNVLPHLLTFASDQKLIIMDVNHPLKLQSLMTPFESPNSLVTMCPQLIDITFYVVEDDISNLASLVNLRKISISNSNFSYIKTFLQMKKKELIFLKLEEVSEVNLKIVNSCEQLKTLEILLCTYENEKSDFSNSHFRNLEHLTVWGFYSTDLESFICAYVNLKTINLLKVPLLTDEKLLNIALKNKNTLEIVSLKICGSFDVETLKFVIDSCVNLKKIIYRSFEVPDFDEMPDLYSLKLYVEKTNIDVDLVLDGESYFL